MTNNKGLTLVEVLVAVSVVVILLVSMVSLLTRSVGDTEFSRNKSLAARYVEEGLEDARTWRDQMGYETFTSTYYDGRVIDDGSLPSPFSRTYRFSNEGADPNKKKKVEVTVTWTDKGRTHQASAVTYLTKW